MADAAIIVYWRHGCFFCTSLLRSLAEAGLTFDRVNIWEDATGAAFVRSVARGNETVPTVRVGSEPEDEARRVARRDRHPTLTVTEGGSRQRGPHSE